MPLKKFEKFTNEDYEIVPIAIGEFTAEVPEEMIEEEPIVDVPEEVTEEKVETDFIGKFLYFDTQVRLWHVVTPSYAEHVALQELYDKLKDDIDELLEMWVKKNGRFDPACVQTFTYQPYDHAIVQKETDQFVELCKQLKTDLDDPAFDNLLDEMIAFCTKIGYLLTLESVDSK